MAIKTRIGVDGRRVLVIHLNFRNRTTRALERYRRDAKVQTKAAATREEQDVTSFWVASGTIAPLLARVNDGPQPDSPKAAKTWEDALKRWREVKAPTLKTSTSKGYERLLATGVYGCFDGKPLTAVVDPGLVAEWDAAVSARGGDSNRRNYHTALRSILGAARTAGIVDATALLKLYEAHPLPKVGETVVEAVPADVALAVLRESDKGVGDYFAEKRKAARRAFALMFYAGLRSSEVRALRWSDIDLKKGLVHVRHGMCCGVEDVPKGGGARTIPLAPGLRTILGKSPKDLNTRAAPTSEGTPWGDTALYQALKRACARVGVDRQKAHALRHAFVTNLFRMGRASAPVVQALAGHADLTTTQRYAHHSEAERTAAVAALDFSKVVPFRKAAG